MSFGAIAGGQPSLLPVSNTGPFPVGGNQQSLTSILLNNRQLLQDPSSNWQSPLVNNGFGVNAGNGMTERENATEIFEKWFDEMEETEEKKKEKKKTLKEDFIIYNMLLIPFALLEHKDSAKDFFASKMFEKFLKKLRPGKNEQNLVFASLLDALDLNAFVNGMSLATGTFSSFPAANANIQPFTANTFNNQPFGNKNFQQSPWQQNNNQLESLLKQNENPESLWSMIQDNSGKLQQPFGSQGQNQGLPGQQGQQQGQSNGGNTGNGREKTWFEKILESRNQNSTASAGNSAENSAENNAEKEAEKRKEEEEERQEQLEEMQEQYQDYLTEVQESRKTTFKEIQLFALLTLPFYLFEYSIGKYFAATELLSVVLERLGVNDENNLIFLLFIQCLDIVALSRGRFKLVDGYQQNWYQELFDYMMTKMDFNDMIRLGAQMLMPQSPAPDYEVR